MDKPTSWLSAGWIFCTLGEYIEHIVDWGHDPAVAYRVIEDGESQEDGTFTRTVVTVFLPDGQILNAADSLGDEDIRASKLLREMLRKKHIA